ncbi:predicted protein [Histoplasma capsulatum var. duboisii H88]|uniref:Predicted protein n=1 Tax=Ajellomyces capsulatus (strain H88) TaxID=544711 RepID=F0UBZ6_AJEC8|nr:predicted protein [Histoplasma capsulatum var. duboisii H88]
MRNGISGRKWVNSSDHEERRSMKKWNRGERKDCEAVVSVMMMMMEMRHGDVAQASNFGGLTFTQAKFLSGPGEHSSDGIVAHRIVHPVHGGAHVRVLPPMVPIM